MDRNGVVQPYGRTMSFHMLIAYLLVGKLHRGRPPRDATSPTIVFKISHESRRLGSTPDAGVDCRAERKDAERPSS